MNLAAHPPKDHKTNSVAQRKEFEILIRGVTDKLSTEPPSREKLSLSLEETGEGLFLLNNVLDVVGSVIQAYSTQRTASFLDTGVILIFLGGMAGISALPVFLAGHINSCSKTSDSGEQSPRLSFTKKEDLLRLCGYGGVYSCAVSGPFDTIGTLVKVLRPSDTPGLEILEKSSLITSMGFSGLGLVFVVGEVMIWTHDYLSRSSESVANESLDTVTIESEGQAAPPKQIAADDSPINSGLPPLDFHRILRLAGTASFSIGGFLDPTGSLFTNFSNTNSTPTENSVGNSILVTALGATALGIGCFLAGYVVNRYYRASSDSVSSNHLPAELPDNNEEDQSLLNRLRLGLETYGADRLHLNTQFGFPI